MRLRQNIRYHLTNKFILSILITFPYFLIIGADSLPADPLRTYVVSGVDLTNIDDAHRPAAIECATNLAAAMREIFARPEAELGKVLEAQAQVALLKVGYNFLQINEIAKRANGLLQGNQLGSDAILKELKKHVSGPARKEMAGHLNDFYNYVSAYEGTNNNPSRDKQEKTLQAIKNFSQKQSVNDFKITDSDLFVFRNLYKKYAPGNLPPNATLMDTLYDQLGRKFRSTDLSQTAAAHEKWNSKLSVAKKHFADYVKAQLRDYLSGNGRFETSQVHHCEDFIGWSDPKKVKFKINSSADNATYENAFPCMKAFVNQLQDANPIADVNAVLNFMEQNDPTDTLGKIDPVIHAQQLYSSQPPCKGNCSNRCSLTRRANGDWWVTLNVYLEHLTGKDHTDASWFVNTGKEISIQRTETDASAREYYQCANPMPVSHYGVGIGSSGKNSSNQDPNSFANDNGCIDRAVYPPSGYRHHGMMSMTVNIGDTRQDYVTLYGKTWPVDATGSGPLMSRRLSITECKGRDAYTSGHSPSGEVQGVEVIKIDDGVAMGLKLQANKIIVQAKTTPRILRNGTYRWTCPNNGADVPESIRAEVCNVRSLYPTKNAEFKRAEVDYVVQVQYFSSVQRAEPGIATLTVPKSTYRIPVVAIAEKADATEKDKAKAVQLQAKYLFPEGQDPKPEKESFVWSCDPENSCSPPPGNIVAEENTFSDWRSFMRKEDDYKVTAKFTSKNDSPTPQMATFTIPKKEKCSVKISKDQTPEDDTKATYEVLSVASNENSSDDISATGTIEWRYKGPDEITDHTKIGKTVEAKRGNNDIKLTAVFKVDNVDECSSEVRIRKKDASDTTDTPLEPLPEIPPSLPPSRFTPIILPPSQGMFMSPGFD